MLIRVNPWLAFLSAAVWSPRRPISTALRYQLIATATYLPWAISGFASGSPSLGSLRSAVAPPPPPAREGFLIRVGGFILSLPLLALRKNSGETLTKPRRARDDQPAAATFSAATRRRLRGGGRSPARARSPIRHRCGKRFGKTKHKKFFDFSPPSVGVAGPAPRTRRKEMQRSGCLGTGPYQLGIFVESKSFWGWV